MNERWRRVQGSYGLLEDDVRILGEVCLRILARLRIVGLELKNC